MTARQKVLIDTDVSIGLPGRDVDDALAIAMALNSPQLAVDAISLTYGNDTLENVKNCMNTLNTFLSFPEESIATGACSADDLGTATPATELIAEKSRQGPLTILALGPLTNIASAIKQNPEITGNIKEIVIVAGRRPGQRFLTGNHPLSHPDLNFEKDPEAAELLLDRDMPVVLAPFEVSSKVWITRKILDLIQDNRTALSHFLVENSLPWLKIWQESFSTTYLPISGFNPFDCLAVAWLTDRCLLSDHKVDLRIEESESDSSDTRFQGTNSKKLNLHAYPVPNRNEAPCHRYIHDVQRELFLDGLIRRLK